MDNINVLTSFKDLIGDSLHYKKIEQYLCLLQKWGKIYNLTADYNSTKLNDHVFDSINLAKYLQKTNYKNIADLGSGAGFPIFICAILLPDKTFSAFEIDANKSTFLRQALIECNITNLYIYGDFKKNTYKYEVVISKAFLQINEFLKVFIDKVLPSGVGIFYLSNNQIKTLKQNTNSKSMLIYRVIYLLPDAEGSFVLSLKNDKNINFYRSFIVVSV